MKFTTLNQPVYKDDNGNPIEADKIEYIAPYTHVADGFYYWECGQCKHKHSNRSCGWSISGQVLKCEKCGYRNLLVKTNIDELNLWMGKNISLEELDAQLQQLRNQVSEHEAEYYRKAEVEKLQEELKKFWTAQQSLQQFWFNSELFNKKPK